jgi:hypothetical protein
MLSSLRSRSLALLVALVLCGAHSGTRVAAQESIPAPAGGEAPPAGVTVTQDTSGLYLEWTIVAIVVGIAVFAVCRSARRN